MLLGYSGGMGSEKLCSEIVMIRSSTQRGLHHGDKAEDNIEPVKGLSERILGRETETQ